MPRPYDVVFRDALIHDGGGAEPRQGDVAVEGERIAEVGALAGLARETVDCRGLALAPGFIDVHTHDDFAALTHPDMGFKLAGGVTTCIVGNCGFGAAPWAAAMGMGKTLHPGLDLPEWQGYAGYAQRLETQPPGVNIGMLVGHGTARLAAMGQERREPTAGEMAAMKSVLEEGLEAGALGLSSGLVYEPGRHAGADELVELATRLRGTGALYATHMRDESVRLLESVREAIDVGRRAGVAVQISHHKASGRSAWGLVRESLALIEAAQREGVAVHADQYPYAAGSTILSAIVDGEGKLRGVVGELEPEGIVVASSARHPDWEGRSLRDLAQAMALSPEAAAARLLAEDESLTVVLHSMSEDDVRTVMRHPSTMIGSDGIPTLEGKPHPRLYGTFARVLGRYAREERLFELPEALRRMTGFPAVKFGLRDRGAIRPGAFADLVVFDPARIIDRGTYEDPHRLPEGIEEVWVNGRAALRAGRLTGVRAGRVLRRAA